MEKKVLIIGYGSIGKRHAKNLIALGIKPYILTSHPDKLKARFLSHLNARDAADIQYCLISSTTTRHSGDVKKCVSSLKGLKRILIEKPLERSSPRGKKIIDIIRAHKLEAFMGYNLRFIPVFEKIKKFIATYRKRIKIVEVVAGQNLKRWRPDQDLGLSYSAYREQGGGVDLDLSHEIDYVLWLFGAGFKNKIIHRAKISDLKINSPDIFKLFLDYQKFIVDITLDYIRQPKERYLKIICDNGKSLYYDFVAGVLKINGKKVLTHPGINESYKKMLKAFLDIDKKNKHILCPVEQGLKVLKVLGV
ncbi:MAG: Gfo/Idh/MocA family oxidoreductase [Candidatus Omnitrophica bacterium]|nr:Gfo/Idh/MocA family oxidoreductase [Candidatus Omnitrophota bacterium]